MKHTKKHLLILFAFNIIGSTLHGARRGHVRKGTETVLFSQMEAYKQMRQGQQPCPGTPLPSRPNTPALGHANPTPFDSEELTKKVAALALVINAAPQLTPEQSLTATPQPPRKQVVDLRAVYPGARNLTPKKTLTPSQAAPQSAAQPLPTPKKKPAGNYLTPQEFGIKNSSREQEEIHEAHRAFYLKRNQSIGFPIGLLMRKPTPKKPERLRTTSPA